MTIEVVVYVKDGGTAFKVIRKFVSLPDDVRPLDKRLNEIDTTLTLGCMLKRES